MSTPDESQKPIGDYQIIGYRRTFNTGNYENRQYYLQIEPHGLSFNEALNLMDNDMEQREQMHKYVGTLTQTIKRFEQNIEKLQSEIVNAREKCFQLEKLVTSQTVGPEWEAIFTSETVRQEWEKLLSSREHLQAIIQDAAGAFDEVFELLDIIDPNDDIPWSS